jgi:hypothetical protein
MPAITPSARSARSAREVANYLAILFGLCAAIAGGMFLMS